jgi:hypothetical protein
VRHIKIDVLNHLVVSAGWGSLLVQRENLSQNYQVIREFRGIFDGREITIMELSVFHNIVIVGNDENILVIDYEFFKILGILKMPELVTAFQFIKLIKLIVISTISGLIYFLSFNIRDQSEIQWEVLAILDLNTKNIINNNNNNNNNNSNNNNNNNNDNSLYAIKLL